MRVFITISNMSYVWKYFEKKKDNAKIVVCKLCQIELKYTSSTTGSMVNHLKYKHPNTGNEQRPTTSLTALDRFVNVPCTKVKSSQIHQMILEIIYTDLLPIRIVESEKFKNLICFLEKGYTMPSRKTIVSLLQKKYEDTKLILIKQIVDSKSRISITTDCWTSLNADSFITITGHFIDSDWHLKSVVLCTQYVEVAHTGANLAQIIDEAVAEFTMDEHKTFIAIHDNAANMNLAMEESKLFNAEKHIGCSAHTLQLAVNGAFSKIPVLQKTIAGVSRLVGHFKRSHKATAALKKKQEDMNIPEHKLIQYCATRWNSVCDMFARILEQRWPVSAVLSDRSITKLSDARVLDLKDQWWAVMQDILQCLETLKISTEMLSTDSCVSVSLVVPIVFSLINNHLKIDDEDSEVTKQFKMFVSQDLQERYDHIFRLEDISENADECAVSPLIVACFLDPRHKHLPFFSENAKQKIYSEVKRQMSTISRIYSQPRSENAIMSQSQPSTSKAARLFGKEYSACKDSNSNGDEVALYTSLPVVDIAADPLIWWKENRQHFPNLLVLALDYLAVPPSSVSSERMFSAAGRLVSKARSRLSSKNVDMMLFLNKNGDMS